MQTSNLRYFALTSIILVGIGLYAVLGQPSGSGRGGAPRWPAAQTVFASEVWSSSEASVEHHTDAGSNTDLVTRAFRRQGQPPVSLTIISSHVPKLYGAGAEVPFLGDGYTSAAIPDAVLPFTSDGVNALVAERGTERWLVMYAFGERRGLLGNGPAPWALAVLDGILGQSNDYYKLYLAARWDDEDPTAARDVSQLAHTVFLRIADWYAA